MNLSKCQYHKLSLSLVRQFKIMYIYKSEKSTFTNVNKIIMSQDNNETDCFTNTKSITHTQTNSKVKVKCS